MNVPALLRPGAPARFPPAWRADAEGLVAIGGDLAPERLLAAYAQGIFPWYDTGLPILWWSPDPRAVLPPERLHVPRSLARTLRSERFRLTWDRSFDDVIRGCAETRAEGTWITPEMIDAYVELHRLGHAHSVEVTRDGALVGGLYGVQVGGLFAAESMFHRETDASKVALVAAVRSLARAGTTLFDVQFLTPHLARFGVEQWPRARYLRRLAEVRGAPVDLDGLLPR